MGVFPLKSLQKQPSERTLVARFRDTYAPTSRKYISNEPQTR